MTTKYLLIDSRFQLHTPMKETFTIPYLADCLGEYLVDESFESGIGLDALLHRRLVIVQSHRDHLVHELQAKKSRILFLCKDEQDSYQVFY